MKVKLAALLIFGLAGLVAAQEPPTPKPAAPVIKAEQVEALIAKLADRDYAVREQADAELRRLGEAALPAIRKHLKDEDPETRMRLRAIMDDLEAKERPAAPVEDEVEPLRPIRPGQVIDPRPRPRRDDFESDEDFRRAMNGWKDQREDRARTEARVFAGNPGSTQSFVIGPGGSSFMSSKQIYRGGERLTLTQDDRGVTFVVEPRDGAKTTASAPDLESFKKEHAELYERYKDTGLFENNSFSFEVLRPDSPLGDLSARELKTHERLKRLLELTLEDPFAELETQLRDLNERQEARDRSLRERLDRLFGELGQDDIFGDIDRFRRSRVPVRPRDEGERLGVVVGAPPAAVAADLDREKLGAEGVYVSAVEPNGLAAGMGIKEGDVLLRIGTTPINAVADLVTAFKAIGPGERVSIGLLRGKESLSVSGLKPGTRKVDEPVKELEPLRKLDRPGSGVEIKKF